MPVDLYKSHSTKFIVEEDGLRPPFTSISGMGNVAAEGIYAAVRNGEELKSVDDLRKRAKIGNAVVDLLKKFNCLNSLPESDQLSFFDAI